MSNLQLGQKIKYYRTRAGVSQLELENIIKASPGSLSRIENNIVNPTKETLCEIASALKLNPLERADLFDIEISEISPEFLNTIVEKVVNIIKADYK